jgi:predicted ATPase/DNA-binding SARP family transcriptional activator
MLEIRLLGTFDVKHKGKVIPITSRPAQSLLAYLILSAGKSHRREKLAGMFWPDSLEQTARENLRHALWRLKKALESASAERYIQADDLSIKFDTSSDFWLDAAVLEALDERSSADELIEALAHYHGELLPGFYEEWVALEREHLASSFEHHIARLMSVLEVEKRWLDILDWGERWIKLGQKPEPAYRALMTAHAAKGDMSKVVATHKRCVKSLKEFGIEPSEQTKELYENLKSGKETLRAGPVFTKPLARENSSNIPVPLTSFIGRAKELKEIAKLLSSSRLVTLTGSGGVGKTRLAIQTAHDAIKRFKDGVVWVGLVGLSDGNLIPQEIAQSLNMRDISQELLIETLKTYLKPKDVLLVIDNCEHLIRACTQVVEQLLTTCPKLKILATSIEALGLFNETTWQVPSLPLPEMQKSHSLKELQDFASIELFGERASHAKSDFVLNEKNAESVIQICQRLDGIPLAIELAAARTKVLSVDEIAARLDDRFSLLTAGSRTAIPRHQTLRAAIDWSYDLLTEPERIFLRRLSVFAGGFTLDAAEVVCSQGMKRSDILDLLGHLVDKSLVIVETDIKMSGTRYRLLETIRQYALEKLIEAGEVSAVRDQHLGFYLGLAEKSEPYIFSGEAVVWISRLGKELDNIRAAMDWSTDSGKAVAALQIAGSLVYFWWARGLLTSEWYDHVDKALSRPEGQERTLARAKALSGIAFIDWIDSNPTDRRPELEEALSIGRELGDRWNIATTLCNFGLLENIRGNYQEARVFLEQSLETWREVGAEGILGYAMALNFLGDVVLNCDERELARSLFTESIAILRQELGDTNFLAYSLRRLGQLAWHEGYYEHAISLCKESLKLNQGVGDPRGVLSCAAGFAAIDAAQGKFQRAAQLMSAVEAQSTAIGIRLSYMDKVEYDRNFALLLAKLDDKTFAKFWERGKKMSFDDAVKFALEGS